MGNQIESLNSNSEQRSAPRVSLMLRSAKLIGPAGEFLCILRDVSATGIKAKLFHPLPAGGPLELELGNGERFAVEPVWLADGHVGCRFINGPVELAALVEEHDKFPKRQIRIKLDLPVIVGGGQSNLAGNLLDLSQHGALVKLDFFLALGQLVTVSGSNLPQRHARVRWRRGSAHGLVFHEGFKLDELARLVAELQSVSTSSENPLRVNH
ncbi:MAG: PilZ domain-containing protein [Novosphingobium sp.]|nr:PilZ domain-containing protein [Brevundimonas sp.]MCZ8320697.1 PilZ domain-containing protein [Novosphingobium sp.]